MRRNPLKTIFPLLISLLVIFSGLLSACNDGGSAKTEYDMAMTPLEELPAEVQSAPVSVQQAYQFAAANPDILTQIPCYCGCGAMGHTSNYACYVSGTGENGQVQYDTHALGCSICVDITQDTMRLLKQGKSVAEIKTSVDKTYSQYGPSNMP